MADVFMNHLVDKALSRTLSNHKPSIFYRYVDDCFAVFDSLDSIKIFCRRRLAGHLFQDRWKDQGRGFILLPPWPPNCLGQMLTVRDFSQHLVSSSKTIRPNIPQGARCMGHCEMM